MHAPRFDHPDYLCWVEHEPCLISAIESVGRENHADELGDALALAIEQPDVDSRWLAGEDVFVSCQVDPSCEPVMTATAAPLAGTIG
jgi:hypothetical protein